MKRKEFIHTVFSGALLLGFSAWLQSCHEAMSAKFRIKKSGVGSKVGHMLRDKLSGHELISAKLHADVLIVGAGISGLTAGYFLQKHQLDNYLIIDLDENPGGNSQSGKNEFSAYPYGAHYLPIPNNENTLLLDFLFEKGIIKSFDAKGMPFYKEEDLCHEPHERLLIDHYWYESFIPTTRLSTSEQEECARFFKFIDTIRNEKGSQGKFVFQIPLADADKDTPWRDLDKISFREYLLQQSFKSGFLHWYLNYCCRDDFGQGSDMVSAFAGLHYFASRRGKGQNCQQNEVLTWEEGNGRLVKLLAETQTDKIYLRQLLRGIQINEEGVSCIVYDWNKNEYVAYTCRQLILAVPFHIRQKLLPLNLKQIVAPQHQPWIVSTILLSDFEDKSGFPLSWDNVFKEGISLGFINNKSQHIGLENGHRQCFTLYVPMDKKSPSETRRRLESTSELEMKDFILKQWQQYYPSIEKFVEEMDWMLWGHGMVSPGIDYLCHEEKPDLRKPIDGKVFFAHTDYSGMSVFEEAFWQGQQAVKELMTEKAKA